jgi:hypothetical protein
VADAVGLPLAAVLRTDSRLAAELDRGELPGARRRSPSRRAAEQCLATGVTAQASRAELAAA